MPGQSFMGLISMQTGRQTLSVEMDRRNPHVTFLLGLPALAHQLHSTLKPHLLIALSHLLIALSFYIFIYIE